MNAMSKTARYLDRFCNFLYWMLIGVAVILIFATGFLTVNYLITGSIFKPNNLYLISFGALQVMMAPGVLEEILTPGYEPWLLGMVVMVLGSLVMYFLMVLTVRDILQPFIHQTPFHETVAKDLKRLSVLLVADTALNAVTVLMMNFVARNYLDLHRLFVGEELIGQRIITVGLANAPLEVTPLVFAAALYLLSKVFLYGQELQTLSDETL